MSPLQNLDGAGGAGTVSAALMFNFDAVVEGGIEKRISPIGKNRDCLRSKRDFDHREEGLLSPLFQPCNARRNPRLDHRSVVIATRN